MCGVDGMLTKLQRFEMAIKFIKLELVGEDDQAGYLRCQRAADRYAGCPPVRKGDAERAEAGESKQNQQACH